LIVTFARNIELVIPSRKIIRHFYKEFFSELWKDICSVLSLTELNVLTLCVQGMSYRDAAEKLEMTEKSVDNAMQRARRKIRALMHDTN
jgi:RNA polymerase sporulation-specific sigma factor